MPEMLIRHEQEGREDGTSISGEKAEAWNSIMLVGQAQVVQDNWRIMFRERGVGSMRASPHHRDLCAALSNVDLILRSVEQVKAFQVSGGHSLICTP